MAGVQVWSWQWVLSGPWYNWPGWHGNWPEQGGKGMGGRWEEVDQNMHFFLMDEIAGARWWPASEMLPCPPRSLAFEKQDFFLVAKEVVRVRKGIEFMTHDLNHVFSPTEWKFLKHDVTNVNMESDGKEITKDQDGMLIFLVGKTAKTDDGTPWTLAGMEWTACYMSCAMLGSPMILLYLGIPGYY